MTAADSPSPRFHRRIDHVLHLVGLGLSLFFLAAIAIIALGDDGTFLNRDWIAFDRTADRLVGRLDGDIYQGYGADGEPWPYLYPPFALPLTLPLALFPWKASFYVAALFVVIPTLVSLHLMSKIAPAPRGEHLAIGSILLSTGTFVTAVVTAQYGALYLLALTMSAHWWARGSAARAGAAAALAAIKPNVAVVPLVLFAWGRARVAVLAFIGAVAAAVIASVVIAPGEWTDFIASTRDVLDIQDSDEGALNKQMTIYTSLAVLVGETRVLVILALWLPIVGVLGVAMLSIWRHVDDRALTLRVFGAVALFTVAANPRLFFYDGVVLLMPAVARYVGRDTYATDRARRATAVLGVVTLASTWGIASGLSGLLLLTGPSAGLWLVVEALDLRHRRGVQNGEGVQRPHVRHA